MSLHFVCTCVGVRVCVRVCMYKKHAYTHPVRAVENGFWGDVDCVLYCRKSCQ